MAKQYFENNVSATLVRNASSTDTVLYFDDVSMFPNVTSGDFFLLTIFSAAALGVESNWEVVKVTAVNYSDKSVTCQRGYEIGASVHVAGELAQMRTTARTLNVLRDSIGAIYGEGGANLVGIGGGRTQADKNAESVSVKDFGAKGDGTTDDTAAVQSAITTVSAYGGAVFFPAGTYRLTSTITTVRGVTLYGVMPVVKAPGGGDFGGGSWLFFDHTGKGISVLNTGGYYTNVNLFTLGTYRTQPTPTVGWAPTEHDYDLYCYGVADVTLDYVTMLNPTYGVGLFGNPANSTGRLKIINFNCQAFKRGIVIDTTYDVVRLDQIHFWPFWRDNMEVHKYCMQNLDAIYSLRNDNPMMSNIFTIFARAGLRIGHGVNGGTSKIHLSNADFDRGVFGVWVDASVTSGCTGQFVNVTHQGETGMSGSKGLFVEGNNSTLSFASFESAYAHQNAVRVEGTGNVVTFGEARAVAYDQSAAGFPAYEALTGNVLKFAVRPVAINGGGSGGKFSPTGTIVCDEWRDFVPVVSAQTGTITTIGTASGKYKVVGNTVHVEFDIRITTNGTAAGDIRFNLPFGVAVGGFVGVGREVNITGKALTCYVAPTNSQVFIFYYDNTYPGANGGRYVGKFEYGTSISV